MNKIGCILLLLICLMACSSATSQEILWTTRIGSNKVDGGTNPVWDSQHNLYFPGVFMGDWCFFKTDTLFRNGYNDIFLVKYDQSGEEEWVLQLGGNNFDNSMEEGMKICYDSATDCILLLGTFSGFVTFDTIQFNTSNDLVLAKYSTNGKCKWAKKFGDLGNEEYRALDADHEGNIYICGQTNYPFMMGIDTIPAGGFIAKFDTAGNIIWAKHKFASAPLATSVIGVTGIRVTTSNILISGGIWIDDPIVVDTITIYHPGYNSCVILLFDLDCNIIKIKEGISPNTGTNSNLSLDPSGNIYLTGAYFDSISFGPCKLHSSSNNQNIFLIKYNEAGVEQWATTVESDNAAGHRVFACPDGSTYVTGKFSGYASFGSNELVSVSLLRDAFLAHFSPEGRCHGAIQFINGSGWCVTVDQFNNPVLVFMFQDSTIVGDSTFIPIGLTDILLVKTDPISSTKEHQGGTNNQLIIYANPTTGRCNITVPEEFKHEDQLTLFIYDSQGKMIQKAAVERSSETYRLDIRAQAAGVYQAVLTNGSRSFTGKIVFTGK
jgi:hypothetical protein